MTSAHKYVSHQLGSIEVDWRGMALEDVSQSNTGWSNHPRLLGDTSQIFHIPKFNTPQTHSLPTHISLFTGLLVIGNTGRKWHGCQRALHERLTVFLFLTESISLMQHMAQQKGILRHSLGFPIHVSGIPNDSLRIPKGSVLIPSSIGFLRDSSGFP